MALKISIITPVYNSVDTIDRCVQCVIDQDYDDFEHIIIDGGSTDGTLECLDKYTHLKILSEPDNGIADAMNKGFNLARGDIIAYLNSDDYYYKHCFRSIIPYFEKGASFVVGRIELIKADGSGFINDPQISFYEILHHWKHQAFPLNPVGYFYKPEIQRLVGGINDKNKYAMDLEFLLRAALICEFTKISPEIPPLGVFDLNKQSTSHKALGKSFFFTKKNFPFIYELRNKLNDSDLRKFKWEQRFGYLNRNKTTMKRKLNSLGGASRFLTVLQLIYVNFIIQSYRFVTKIRKVC